MNAPILTAELESLRRVVPASIGQRRRPLSLRALGLLPAHIRRPLFDPRRLRPGILHVGCGAFHRAHQAVFTQHAIDAEFKASGQQSAVCPPPWGIVAASLRSSCVTAALARQEGLYSVIERDRDTFRTQVVSAIRRTIFNPDEPFAVQSCFADPAIRIVTLTVTASGYCVDPLTGRLDARHPDVEADLRNPAPAHVIGLLVHGLAERRRLGLEAPVIMSCDNLERNGRVLRQACVDYSALVDDGLSSWIERNVLFPCTVVDRIVPAASQLDRNDSCAALRFIDEAPVSAEPFSQWIIERFEGSRPLWEAAGARFVADTGPWEASKLRLLNGGHLALAMIGLLVGDETIADVLMSPLMRDYASSFMLLEQKPTLPSSDHDIDLYARQLIDRWRNPSIVHRLDRIGRDASAKLAARLLGSIDDNLREHRQTDCTVLAIAAWMQLASGRHGAMRSVVLARRHIESFDAMPQPTSQGSDGWVDVFMDHSGLFCDALRQSSELREALKQAWRSIDTLGPKGAVARCLSRTFR
jgi:fructuronate reductase